MPRRRLAQELRRLREQADLTLEEVAAALLISTSKLSRLENAQGSPQPRDVRDLIRLYKIEGTQLAARLMRWVTDSRKQGWWIDYSDATDQELLGYVAYEHEASLARVYTIPVLPVLLQTADYARAQYRSMEPWRSSDELDRLVRLRLERQAALSERPDRPPLHLLAVTHECSLRQLVGNADIMRTQLDQLVERSTEPNIELRVLPFRTPPLRTSTCMYSYFEFPDAIDRDTLHIETHAGFRHIETPDIVYQYRRHYDELFRAALSPEDSRQLIRSIQAAEFP